MVISLSAAPVTPKGWGWRRWTPLIPATMPDTIEFGKPAPLGRPAQPAEMAPAGPAPSFDCDRFGQGGTQGHRQGSAPCATPRRRTL